MLASMDSNVDGEISEPEWDAWWTELAKSQGGEKHEFMLAYFERCLDKFDELGMGIPTLPESQPEPEAVLSFTEIKAAKVLRLTPTPSPDGPIAAQAARCILCCHVT